MSKKEHKEFIARIRVNVKDYLDENLEQKISINNQEDDSGYKEERERTKGEYERKSRTNKIKNTVSDSFLEGLEEEKKLDEIVEKLINLESDFLNIKSPNYLFYHKRKTEKDTDIEYGYYEKDTDTIYINLEYNTNYWELFDTIIHEIRHKYQYEVMEEKEKYPEIREKAKEYLRFSKETYPYDEKDSLYDEKYKKNGLESDTFAYTSSRMRIYLEQNENPKDILKTDVSVKRIVKNQILMSAGDSNRDGGRAPITVSKSFEEKDFTDYFRNEIEKKFESKEEKIMGQGVGATDFSENAQTEAAKRYGDMIEHIQFFSEKMIGSILERVKTHPYKKLENVINTFIYYYNEKLPSEIKLAIDEWIQSDNSFAVSLRKHDAGNDASINAAERLQENLKEKVDESFKQIDSVKVELAMDVDEEKIYSDTEFIQSYFKSLQNLKSDWIEEFQKLSEQNSLYINVSSLVADTFTHVEKIYQAAQNDILNVGDEFSNAWNNVIEFGTTFSNERMKIQRNISDIFTAHRKRR